MRRLCTRAPKCGRSRRRAYPACRYRLTCEGRRVCCPEGVRLVQDVNLSVSSNKVNWPSVIRNFRMSKRLKQAALAADLGVTQAMISRWENGDSEPPERIKRRMAELVQDAFVIAPAPTWADLVTLNPGIELVTDSMGMIKAISRGALELFGVRRNEMEGRNINDFLGGDFKEALASLRREGMFQNNLAYAQSLGSLEANVSSGFKALLCDFIHWPRISEARTTYCVHTGAVLNEKQYTARLEERSEKLVLRRTF
ncbi:helix-turn-helix domain-containing protein [Maricaulis sp. CAU 1757]